MASTTHQTTSTERLRPFWRPVDSTTGDPAYSGVLQRDEQAAEDARKMVDTVLAVWHLEQLADDAKLVATELVANASRHARGTVVRMVVTRTARYRVRVAITDKSRALPALQLGDPLAETGRGLRLVDGVSSKWGVIPYNWGKSLWAEVGTA
ncbi:ATP-binding protein [Streptomyces dangxiongensis]|uniref:ATP-binding protein n=1 Tax=Streptomyces dangxiongensis TaxID=1442032 RepID=A0A3G2JH28_9ACTN|nr:ATP-binding protein [Streptomyces dangxiongensis]AYN40951.1 ATP-binding protein [Streptomyces dangxiongensis]